MRAVKRIRTSEVVQERARELRQRMTPAEALLWESLRGRRLGGLKFRRQHPIGRAIADFYSAECRLVIELDGGVHEASGDYDLERSAYLTGLGYRVIRFGNAEVEQDLDQVLQTILAECTSPPSRS